MSDVVLMYRYQEAWYTSPQMRLMLRIFHVIKTTPAGVWIDVYGSKKFVLLNARKRFVQGALRDDGDRCRDAIRRAGGADVIGAGAGWPGALKRGR